MALPAKKERYTFADRMHEVYGQEDVAKVNILDGCFVELNKVFSE